VRQRFIGRGGSEDENSMTFSVCREYQARDMMLPEYWEPNSGIFQFQGEHGTIGSGFRSQWRTAPRAR